jgi:hypothetical protein
MPSSVYTAGMVCPQGHGPLLLMSDGGLFCPHSEHNGAPRGKEGPPPSPAFFSHGNVPAPVARGTVARAEVAPAEARAEAAPVSNVRTCTVCGGTYGPGGYGTHKNLPSHKAELGRAR